MKKKRKKTVIIAMVGVITGIMLNIVFSQSPFMLAVIPVAGVVGGLIGTIIDKRKNQQ